MGGNEMLDGVIGTDYLATNRQVFSRTIKKWEEIGHCMFTLQANDTRSYLRSHKWIAIAVATYPRTHGEWTGIKWNFNTQLRKRTFKIFKNVAKWTACNFIKVVKRIARFIQNFRASDAQFICLPEQIHNLSQALT